MKNVIEEIVLVLSANKWDFTDDRTKERRQGTTVHVCHLNQDNSNVNGSKPVKYTLSPENMHALDTYDLPAAGTMIADFDFVRSRLTPTSFKDLNSVDLGELIG